ncbi:hypothetical protein ACFXPZ_22865, partial [Streptomyces sp. NPDC059101]
ALLAGAAGPRPLAPRARARHPLRPPRARAPPPPHDLLIGPARDAFRRHLTGRGYRPEATIAKAQLGPEAGMVGAADLARLVARRFRRANRRRAERYERYERSGRR